MLRVCVECETAYAADLEKCPHCGSAEYIWNHELAAAPAPVLTKRKRAAS